MHEKRACKGNQVIFRTAFLRHYARCIISQIVFQSKIDMKLVQLSLYCILYTSAEVVSW